MRKLNRIVVGRWIASGAFVPVRRIARADDTAVHAPFPTKAVAILVQHSAGSGGDSAFGGDITAVQGVFSDNALNWKYNTLGANGIQTLN